MKNNASLLNRIGVAAEEAHSMSGMKFEFRDIPAKIYYSHLHVLFGLRIAILF
jgi:hypothetical protein